MTDELQAAEAAEVEQTEAVEAETPNAEESGSAPDSGKNHEEKVTFTDEQQKVLDDLAAKKTFKIKEAEREAERLRKELEDTKAKLPQETRPEVPPLPDPYDDDYEAKVLQRDDTIRQAAEFDARQSVLEEQQRVQAQQQEREQQEAQARVVEEYAGRATKLGVDTNRLVAAENKIVEFGIDAQLAHYILGDEAGPLIATYLADNLVELDNLNRMGSLNAAVRIASDIKQKAVSVGVKKQPTAPEPIETLKGAGIPPQDRGPQGATFK